MKYKVRFPFVPDMGSISPMVVNSSPGETAKEQALWHFNKMREHDGLAPRKTLPDGTKFNPIYE
jgi:hypothetical protein